MSIVIRWLVLPRSTAPGPAFFMFIVGLVLAEACGLLGTFLGGPYRDSLFVLGVLGVTQYVPFYARKLFEPKGSGFIPGDRYVGDMPSARVLEKKTEQRRRTFRLLFQESAAWRDQLRHIPSRSTGAAVKLSRRFDKMIPPAAA